MSVAGGHLTASLMRRLTALSNSGRGRDYDVNPLLSRVAMSCLKVLEGGITIR
jgi:hypothetical protein